MDLVKRKVFTIDDVDQSTRLVSIYNDAFSVDGYSELGPSFFRDIIIYNGHNLKLYGINNIYNNFIGFAFYRLRPRFAVLDTLAVMSDYQNMKVGKLLLRESLSDLVQNAGVTLVTASSFSRTPVLSFYKSCGFTNMDGTPIDPSKESENLTKIKIWAK